MINVNVREQKKYKGLQKSRKGILLINNGQSAPKRLTYIKQGERSTTKWGLTFIKLKI